MIKKICLLVFLTIFLVNVVSATEERDIFIIDNEGNTQYKYQIVSAVDEGYYIEAQDLSLVVPENATNLKFYDSSGIIKGIYSYSDEGYKIYNVRTKQIEYNEPYEVGFIYDLPKYTTIRYKENYFFEYPYYLEVDSEKNTYFCIPSSASRYASSYDSTPDDDWRATSWKYNLTYIPRIEIPKIKTITPITPYTYSYKSEYEQIKEIDLCPSSYIDEQVYSLEKGEVTTLKLDFKNPSNRIDTYNYNGDKITIEVPNIYRSIIDKHVAQLEKTLHSIGDKLSLNPPNHYKITFVSDNDKVLLGDNAMVSYEDGTVYFQTGLMRLDNDQLLQINLLRGIINSAMLNTYGTSTDDSWWTNGALTSSALIIMKDNNLPVSDIQQVLNDIKDLFNELTTNEIIELMQDKTLESRANIDSGIVDEIDKLCPDHAIKLNKITKSMTSLTFSNDKEFNNYILYHLREECSKDISVILDKYKLDHDNVQLAVDKYDKLKEKFNTIQINRDDILELNTIRTNLEEAEKLMKKGNVQEATRLIKEADNIYETKLKKLIEILQEYSEAEKKSDSISVIFAIPSRLMTSNHLNGAITDIKNNEFDSARKEINDSLFWANNAISLSMILYVLIIGGCILVYFKVIKPKHLNEKHKQHRYQH